VIILETLGDCAIFGEILSRFGPLHEENARNELCKEIALRRVALAFGFDVNDFGNAIRK
jgi:hypothetical protein